MRIAHILEATTGGAARHVVDLSAQLIENGHAVSLIYSPLRADSSFEAEIASLAYEHLVRLPMRRAVGPWDILAARSLRRVLNNLGPFDVIHGHSSKAGALARLAAPQGPARIYTPHAFRTMDPTTGRLGRLIYGGAEALLGRFASDAVVAVSPEEADHARLLGVPSGKVHTVVNGVTPAPRVDRAAARTALGLQPDDIAVGFVGRLCTQKCPERFAASIAIANAADPHIRGIMLGDGELKDAALAQGGKAVVAFSGLNARQYLPAFDLFVMTSRYEAMPYVLLEALQAGLPIIATAVGGTSIALKDGENGTLLDLNATPAQVADAILQNSSEVVRLNYGNASKKKSASLTALAMAEATIAVYRAALYR